MIRPARLDDAPAIAAVHVAAWRSAYAGLLPAGYLAKLSTTRSAAQFDQTIARGPGVLVAEAEDRVVGFCTVGRPRSPGLADGEVETLYVQDDHRDQGHGRALLQAAARHLAAQGCTSLYLWVLADNHSRFFYDRLRGRPTATSTTYVEKCPFQQTAYVWNPITTLTTESSRPP